MASLTEEEIAYMLAHKDDSRVVDIYVCSIITSVASVLVLVLRFWSRRLHGGRVVLDLSDWFILAAWVCYIACMVSFSLGGVYGLGIHVIFVTHIRELRIWGIVLEVFYYFCIGFIKFSILSLYGRIFPSKKFHIYLWIVAAFVAGWSISSVIVSIAQCLPIQFGWDPSIPGGFCINYGLLVLVAGIINVVTDFVILGLPIPMILRLWISKRKKRLLLFTFAAGSSACIVSIVRLAFSLAVSSTSDVSWDNVPTGFVSSVELLVGILAASIPTYRPLYRRYIQRTTGQGSQYKSGNSSNGHGPSQSYSAKISAARSGMMDGPGVHVTDEIELISHESQAERGMHPQWEK